MYAPCSSVVAWRCKAVLRLSSVRFTPAMSPPASSKTVPLSVAVGDCAKATVANRRIAMMVAGNLNFSVQPLCSLCLDGLLAEKTPLRHREHRDRTEKKVNAVTCSEAKCKTNAGLEVMSSFSRNR